MDMLRLLTLFAGQRRREKVATLEAQVKGPLASPSDQEDDPQGISSSESSDNASPDQTQNNTIMIEGTVPLASTNNVSFFDFDQEIFGLDLAQDLSRM